MHRRSTAPIRHPLGFVEPCLPTISRTVPTGPQWAFEIKHDGFRFHRKQVRIYSRGGHDWSERLPSITAAMRALPVRSVMLDGEGVICGPDGKSDFDRMRACFSRHGAPEAFLYAFDALSLMVAICGTSHGVVAVPPWCGSWTGPSLSFVYASISRT